MKIELEKILIEIKNYMMEGNEQNTLIPFITKALLKYYDEIFSLYPYLYLYNNQQIVKKLSRFRVNRYDTKTNMALHIDNIHNWFDGDPRFPLIKDFNKWNWISIYDIVLITILSCQHIMK